MCPEKGENCSSLKGTKVAELVSNCSLRSQTVWRNLMAIPGSKEMKRANKELGNLDRIKRPAQCGFINTRKDKQRGKNKIPSPSLEK